MARYGSAMQKATTNVADTAGVGSIENPGSGPRRIALYDLIFGADGAPADNNFRVDVQRATASATGTSVTPNALDPADPAANTETLENVTAGASTANAVPLSFPLNQRATFRWVAAPGSEIIIPAAIDNGLRINTPVALNTPAAAASVMFDER